MKALRLVLHQSSANYKKEETVDNKMTYPLPPLSTVIGALHAACGYNEYKPMDISIQGKFESMHKKPYTDHCFLNSIMDDRGILVKMRNGELLSSAFEKVASAQKPQGNSFRYGKTIQVYDQKLLQEYRDLKDLNDEIDVFNKTRINPVLELIKKRKKTLANKKKKLDKKSAEYAVVEKREKEIKGIEKEIKEKRDQYKMENYTLPISRFRSLTTSLKFYEILDEVTLILHIRAEEDVLIDILNNIYNLTSIGRSEDTVIVENAEIVDLIDDLDDEVESQYSAYLDYDLISEKKIYPKLKNKNVNGTRYYLNKDYTVENQQRVFNKKKVLYTSQYVIDECCDNLFVDEYDGRKLIVNFL